MRLTRSFPPHFAAAFGLLAGAAVCPAQDARVAELEQRVNALEERNQALQRSLAEANRSEKQASEQLAQVRTRLEALGKNLLDGGEDRLIQLAADFEVSKEQLNELQGVSTRLASAVTEYLRQAVVSDPAARLEVETSLRKLDAQLGLRQKPRPDVRTGSLQQAKIVSIDQESGLLVLNVGEAEGSRIGMSFQLSRANQPYGKAIVADVRKAVSGAFVDHLDRTSETARLGDTATLETQP
jgi:flagellar basal body-associated protein FliL